MTIAFGTARRVVDVAIDRQVTFLAAAIAYYAFVSLIPALLLLVVVATAVFGETIAGELVAAAGGFLTPAGEEAVAGAIGSAGGRTGASVLGVAVLLWSTLKVFRGLDTAFAELYGVKEPPDFVKQLTDAGSVVLGVGVGVGVMVVVGAFVAAADAVPAVEAVSILALPAFLAVAFLPMYYLLPQPRIGLREALPGAAVAAVGWTLLQAGFQLYAASAGQYQVYGVIGGVLLLVTWLYLAAVVVVVGGVVNVVLAGRDGASPAGGAGLDLGLARLAGHRRAALRHGGHEDGPAFGRFAAARRSGTRPFGRPRRRDPAPQPHAPPPVAAPLTVGSPFGCPSI